MSITISCSGTELQSPGRHPHVLSISCTVDTLPMTLLVRFSPELNKWIELGNSGMFRPEMLLPMGLPEDVRVIAYGLGLER